MLDLSPCPPSLSSWSSFVRFCRGFRVPPRPPEPGGLQHADRGGAGWAGWCRPRARACHASGIAGTPPFCRAPTASDGQEIELGEAFHALLCGKGSVLWKVAQESQIPLLVTFCKIDVIPVQVCARKWSSRCMQ